jgi:hypothetical protein
VEQNECMQPAFPPSAPGLQTVQSERYGKLTVQPSHEPGLFVNVAFQNIGMPSEHAISSTDSHNGFVTPLDVAFCLS